MMGYMYQKQAEQTEQPATYEVDTIQPDGSTTVDHIPIRAAFSLGRQQDKDALVEILPQMKG